VIPAAMIIREELAGWVANWRNGSGVCLAPLFKSMIRDLNLNGIRMRSKSYLILPLYHAHHFT